MPSLVCVLSPSLPKCFDFGSGIEGNNDEEGGANQQEALKLLSYQTSNTALVGLFLGACCCVKMDLFDVLKRTYMLFSVVLNSKFPLWGVE